MNKYILIFISMSIVLFAESDKPGIVNIGEVTIEANIKNGKVDSDIIEIRKNIQAFKDDTSGDGWKLTNYLTSLRKKEAIPELIKALNDKDKHFVFGIEEVLLRITGQGFYGVCIGNTKGVDEFNRWWEKNNASFIFPDSPDYYIKDYYDGTQSAARGDWFVDNAVIVFWRNINKNALKYNNRELDEGSKVFANKLISNTLGSIGVQRSFQSRYLYEIFDYFGKAVVGIIIDDSRGMYSAEKKDAIISYLRYYFNNSYFNELTKNAYKENFADTLKNIRSWWDANKDKIAIEVNRNHKDKEIEFVPKINIKPVFLNKISEGVEREIKENIEILCNLKKKYSVNDSWKAMGRLKAIGPLAIPYILEKSENLNGWSADRIFEDILPSYNIGSPHIVFSDDSKIKTKKWKEWYESSRKNIK